MVHQLERLRLRQRAVGLLKWRQLLVVQIPTRKLFLPLLLRHEHSFFQIYRQEHILFLWQMQQVAVILQLQLR